MTLTVLAPYRSLSIGSHLIEYLVSTAALSPLVDAQEVYAHVWVANKDAMRFYKSRGFDTEMGELVENYYRRLRSATAKVVKRSVLRVRSLVSQAPEREQGNG